jgi:predicted nucleotidyltransferase
MMKSIHCNNPQRQTPAERQKRRLTRTLRSLVSQLKRRGAKKILLFGSLARDQVREDSDLDLIVVLESEQDNPVRRLAKLYSELEFREAVDLRVYTPEQFKRARSGPFLKEVLKEAIELYDEGRERGQKMAPASRRRR